MQIANIYSIKNQNFYRYEKFVMILAHLFKQYKPENFNNNQYIIMDNGLYEESQVSTKLQDIVDMADRADFKINELIVPDVLNDLHANIKMFEDNLLTIKKYDYRITFMFVAQAKNENELREAINYINQYYGEINLSVGISKLCPFDRASKEAIEIYKTCKFPIHFLGIKTTFEELLPVKDIIRSCDTSQLAYIAKNEKVVPDSVVHYKRSGRRSDGRGVEGVDIDLANDFTNPIMLFELQYQLKEEFDNEH